MGTAVPQAPPHGGRKGSPRPEVTASAIGSAGASGAPGPDGRRVCATCGAVYTEDDAYCRADGTRLQDATAPEDTRIGEVVDGRYTLTERLGQGAMGVVYRAIQRGLERDVAVKILKRVEGEEHPSARRFMREVRTVSLLSHPNIVTVYDFGETARGEPYLSMELLRGTTLRQLLAAEGPLGPERALALVGQVCEGLAAAHAKGIIHRDLKPSNVIVVAADGATPERATILDFGLAKLQLPDTPTGSAITRAGNICGTPLYMSPEQALGLELDGRSDIYALGLIAFELLTGAKPFRERAVPDILRERIQAVAPAFVDVKRDVLVHPAIEAAVLRALARDPDGRPATPLALKAELERAVAQARNTAGAATVSLPALSGAAHLRTPTSPGPPLVGAPQRSAAAPPAPIRAELPRIPAPEETPPRPPAEHSPNGALRKAAAHPEARPAPGAGNGSHSGAAARPGLRSDGGAAIPAAPRRGSSSSTEETRRSVPGAAAGRRPTTEETRRSVPGAAAGRRPTTEPDSLSEQVAAAERMLAVAGDGPRRPWCEVALAELRWRQGRSGDAERHAREALRLLRNGPELALQARAAELLADVAEAEGSGERACDWVALAADHWRSAGNRGRLAFDLGRLGGLYFQRKHHGPARVALEEAVALDREDGDPERLAANLRGLGAVMIAGGKLDAAEILLRQALQVESGRADPAGEGWCHHHLGRVAEARGAWADAVRLHERALALRRDAGDEGAAAVSLQHLATALVQSGRIEEARERLNEVLALHRRRGEDSGVALSLRRLGDVLGLRGDSAGAAECYEKSEALFQRIGSPLAGGRSAALSSVRPGGSEEALRRALAEVNGGERP